MHHQNNINNSVIHKWNIINYTHTVWPYVIQGNSKVTIALKVPPLNPIVKLSDKTQSCNKYTLCIHEMFTLDILS